MKNLFYKQAIIQPPIEKSEYITGFNLLNRLHELDFVRNRNYGMFAIVSDQNVNSLFCSKIKISLGKLGKPVLSIKIPRGEECKSFSVLEETARKLISSGVNKKSCLIGLGGGATTDLCGFISSVLLRGISSIFIPTTLLAQIDAAIGGKNGINIDTSKGELIKNMVGTIRQPDLVISDIDCLHKLPERELVNGLGEMAKYFIGWGKPEINDIKLFINIKDQNKEKLASVVAVCQGIKQEIISQDPLETEGNRRKLNLGHTVGHALESAACGKLSHGEAVALGLCAAIKISQRIGFLPDKDAEKIINKIHSLGLPYKAPTLNKLKVIKAMSYDKKGGTFVLVKGIGKLVTDVRVENSIVSNVLEEIV